MVKTIQAYRSSTGAIFETIDAADKDEIRNAADTLAGAEKNHLINIATGLSTSESTREAILRLAQAIKELPVPAPPAVNAMKRVS